MHTIFYMNGLNYIPLVLFKWTIIAMDNLWIWETSGARMVLLAIW